MDAIEQMTTSDQYLHAIVENFNSAVDKLVDFGLLRRLLVMTDISFSNSLIESW